jgi:hypothetical protein
MYTKSNACNKVFAYRYNDFKYEIQIKIKVKGRGSIHNPSFWSNILPYRLTDYDWIYTNTINDRLDSNEFIFTHYQRETKHPWIQDSIQGYINFKTDSMIIDLMIPHYKGNSIDHWVPYEFNGRYNLIIKQDSLSLLETID